MVRRATVKRPAARAKSRTAVACQRPLPMLAPLANTRIPSGVPTLTSKSAVGDVHVSPCRAGGSSAQSVPLQASSGKNEVSRTIEVDSSRSVGLRGSRSVQLIETLTRSPAATGRATTSVVGSGSVAGTPAPSTRTLRTSSRAPTCRCTGMFGQRRKTIRSLGRSSANETREVPWTTFLPAVIEIVIAYVGRLAGRAGSAAGAGQPAKATKHPCPAVGDRPNAHEPSDSAGRAEDADSPSATAPRTTATFFTSAHLEMRRHIGASPCT